MSKNFTYHTEAKDEAEAIALCEQCYSNPIKSKISTHTFSNIVIAKVEVKDGLWTVTGTFDEVKTEGVVSE